MYSQKIYLIFIDLTLFTFCFFKLELERKKEKQNIDSTVLAFFWSWFILFSLLIRALSIKHPNCTNAGHWDLWRRLQVVWRLWSHAVAYAPWIWKSQPFLELSGDLRITFRELGRCPGQGNGGGLNSAFDWLLGCRVKREGRKMILSLITNMGYLVSPRSTWNLNVCTGNDYKLGANWSTVLLKSAPTGLELEIICIYVCESFLKLYWFLLLLLTLLATGFWLWPFSSEIQVDIRFKEEQLLLCFGVWW